MNKPRVMIIEDELIAQFFYKESLKNDFTICGIFDNGNEAISQVDELKPDIIISDIVIKSGPDGVETVRRILFNHNIPVVFITSQIDSTTIQRAKMTKPFCYLIKPIERDVLVVNLQIALDIFNQIQKIDTNPQSPDSQQKKVNLSHNIDDGLLEKHQITKVNQIHDQNKTLVEIVNNKFMKQYWVMD